MWGPYGEGYPHIWQDYPLWEPGRIFIDVPLVDVVEGGGPLEIWPGTHRLVYNDTFANADALLRATRTSEDRQYFKCFPEILTLTQVRAHIAPKR